MIQVTKYLLSIHSRLAQRLDLQDQGYVTTCVYYKDEQMSLRQNVCLVEEFLQGPLHVSVPQAVNEGVQQWGDHCIHHRGNYVLGTGGAG